MEISVTRSSEGWCAHERQEVVGELTAWVRPDKRWFVRFRSCQDAACEPLLRAASENVEHDLYSWVDESDVEGQQRLGGLGFRVNRRENDYRVPTDPAVTGLAQVATADRWRIVTADSADEDRLRVLDDELRQDVPGCDGWEWDREGFRDETYDPTYFDPTTYLVAIDPSIDRYAGLVRIWNNPSGPKLGMVGIARQYRRQGLATILLARAFKTLYERGKIEVVTSGDVDNTASNALLLTLGAHRTGGSVELIRTA